MSEKAGRSTVEFGKEECGVWGEEQQEKKKQLTSIWVCFQAQPVDVQDPVQSNAVHTLQ